MHILLVEDEPGIVNFLKQGLEEESFTVSLATDGPTGLQLALTNQHDLILLDWMLPGLSGLEICTEFRTQNTETPIIFLTAKDTTKETIIGLQSGANDYIKKPFHFDELLERIKVQLRSKSVLISVLQLGSLSLNPEKRELKKGESIINLTQKEFDLLAYLMQNKGKVCTRAAIIENVWDIHFDYDTGVIDVFINALRKKLQLTENENYITTVRGVGYMANEA